MKKISREGFGFIELLLALLLVVALYYLGSKFYFGKAPLSKEIGQTLAREGIDTTSYKSVLDTTKAKLSDIQKQQEEQAKKLEEMQ